MTLGVVNRTQTSLTWSIIVTVYSSECTSAARQWPGTGNLKTQSESGGRRPCPGGPGIDDVTDMTGQGEVGSQTGAGGE